MDRVFSNEYGRFTLDDSADGKMVSLFERDGHHQKEDVELLREHVSSDSIVLDIGAHVGTMTVPLAKAAKEVHAFEPVEGTRRYLQKNIRDNDLANVTVHSSAVGAKNGSVGMAKRSATNAGAFTVEEGRGTELRSLDSFGFGRVDLIKIDVEGYEPEVFEGAKELLARARPVLFFEVNLPELRRHGKSPLRRIERALRGYVFYVNGRRVPSVRVAALFLEPKFFLFNRGGIVFNVLAIPRGGKR